jgi:hypothetical protein
MTMMLARPSMALSSPKATSAIEPATMPTTTRWLLRSPATPALD